MSLFRPYKGLKADFENVPFHDGYAYFIVDTGEFVIDFLDADNNEVRKYLNSDKTWKIRKEEDGVEYELEFDDILTINDIIDIEHGGTDADNAEDARDNLDVYGKDEVYTKDEVDDNAVSKSYTATLRGGEYWLYDTNDETMAYQEYSNTALTCGKDGNVPPIITYTSNQEGYSKIERAVATTGSGIVFYIKRDKIPEDDIELIITDNK